jgi:hypothetical protein
MVCPRSTILLSPELLGLQERITNTGIFVLLQNSGFHCHVSTYVHNVLWTYWPPPPSRVPHLLLALQIQIIHGFCFFLFKLPYMRKNMQQFFSWVCDIFSPFLLALLIEQRGFILILPRVHIRCLIFIHLSVTLSYPSSSCPFKNTLVGLSILYSYIHLEGLQSHLPSYHPSPIPTGSFPPNSPLLYSCHFLRSAFYVRKKCSIWLSESGLFHLT